MNAVLPREGTQRLAIVLCEKLLQRKKEPRTKVRGVPLKKNKGLTLIELLISIAITVIIGGALYFSLNTALESWSYTKDQLALQKVLSQVMKEIISGSVETYGLRDSLEIKLATNERIEYVPPWTDDTHTVAEKDFIYTLNRRIKPGTAVPIGELKLFESREYRLIPVTEIERDKSGASQVKLGLAVSSGGQLRFSYHPDSEDNPDVIESVWWDNDDKAVYAQYIDETENISKNLFGVEIVEIKLSYYDNTNKLITDSEYIDDRDLNMITGIEVFLKAKLGNHTRSLMSFVNLRNSPLRSGYLSIREGVNIPIPDSEDIFTLLLTNISGVNSGDTIILEAVPEVGKSWTIKIKFSQVGSANPKIESFTIEYPPGYAVHTEYPRSDIDTGLSLLELDPGGLYDYDDDEDTEDVVVLSGDVLLEVKRMEVEGAGIFVKP